MAWVTFGRENLGAQTTKLLRSCLSPTFSNMTMDIQLSGTVIVSGGNRGMYVIKCIGINV